MQGTTCLMIAAASRNMEVIEMLLAEGANVNAQDKLGHTPIVYATRSRKDEEKIERLLQAGADAKLKDLQKRSILMHLIAKKAYGPDISKELEQLRRKERKALKKQPPSRIPILESGADVHATDHNGRSALMYAASNGEAHIIPHLLQAGADVHAKDSSGYTSLMYAASGGNPLEIEDDTGMPQQMDTNDWKDLLSGKTEAAELLIEAGADINATNKQGCPPLFFAAGALQIGNQSKPSIKRSTG